MAETRDGYGKWKCRQCGRTWDYARIGECPVCVKDCAKPTGGFFFLGTGDDEAAAAEMFAAMDEGAGTNTATIPQFLMPDGWRPCVDDEGMAFMDVTTQATRDGFRQYQLYSPDGSKTEAELVEAALWLPHTCEPMDGLDVPRTLQELVDKRVVEEARARADDSAPHNSPPVVTERMDLLPFKGVLRAARAMGHGMEQGYETEDGDYCHWKAQPASYHLNRALRHIALWKSGDRSEEHVDHVISRILMWGALEA